MAPAVAAARALGAAAVVLACVWSLHFRGGVAWLADDKALIFNWHPISMVLGPVVLVSESALVYRTIEGPHERKKAIHLVINVAALVVGVLGAIAVLRFHNESRPPIKNFYSLHSWFGITTLSLLVVQVQESLRSFLVGFTSFWYPGADGPTRRKVLPLHRFLGVYAFVLALATAVLGIQEKLTLLQSLAKLDVRGPEFVTANILGLTIFALGGAALLVLSTRPRDDDYAPLE
eukprot:SM001616S02289  [mRNA]  locus=s1616:540:2043:- [translate_table: standard]